MTDVELRLTADVDQATKKVGGFRKEYADLVKAIEKPLRQVNAFRELEASLENTEREARAARDRVRDLGNEMARTAAPGKELAGTYRDAVNELRRLERAEVVGQARLIARRREMQAAGVDTRNLATEQRRLSQEMQQALSAGQADQQLQAAQKSLGVGEIERTQRELVRLRAEYQLLTSVGNLSAKQRAEAEANYHRSVKQTLGELRTLRAATKEQELQARATATSEARRHALAREGIRAQAAAIAQAAREQRAANLEAARADLGVNRYRALQSEVQRVRQQYELLRTSGRLSTTELALAQRTMTQRIRETQRAMRELNVEQRRSGGAGGGIGGLAARAGSAYLAARAVTTVTRQADQWVELTDRIRLATTSREEYDTGLERLRSISDRTFTSMTNNAEIYIGALTPLRERGFSSNDALRFTEALGLGLVASAAKGERAASVINQFNNALQDGELRGDAFNSMIRNTPALADALARGLGKTREELAAMADAGELTTDVFVPALISQLDSLGEAVDGMNITAGDGFVRVMNAWQEAVGKADLKPLTTALNELANTLRDPAVSEGLTTVASFILQIGGAAVGSAADLLDMAKQAGTLAAQLGGASNRLADIDREIKAIDKSMDESLSVGDWLVRLLYSPEELKAKREALRLEREQIIEDQSGMTAELQFLAEVAAAAAEEGREQERAAYRRYIADIKKLQGEQVKAAKEALKAQVQAEKEAQRELKKVQDDRLKIEGRYREALANLGGTGQASYSAAQALKVGAREALRAGDVEGAQSQAQAALKMLQELQAAGENTYGFGGFIQELQAIELAANDIEKTRAEEKIRSIREQMAALEAEAKKLEKMPVSVEADSASIDQVRTQIEQLITMLGSKEIVIPVRLEHPDGPIIPNLPEPPGFAYGGYTGPGSKYQPAGIVHAGEHVQPQEVVREPGALPFLERIRRNGFRATLEQIQRRGYANGGPVVPIPRFVPNVPAPSQALLDAAAGPSMPHLGSVDFNLGGESFQVFVNQSQVDPLRLAARKFGRTHRNG